MALAVGFAQKKLVLNISQFEKNIFASNPILQEKELRVEKERIALRSLEMAAILPKFQLEAAGGPAPGIALTSDTNYIQTPQGIDNNIWILNSSRDFDLSSWGPFFGLELTAAQPLNVYRYRMGHKAQELNIQVEQANQLKERIQVSREAQEIYWGYLLAKSLVKEVRQAEKDFNDAEEKVEEMLDEEVEGVQQKDLLKLKASRFSLEKGKNEAETGLKRARLGTRFYLSLPDSVEFEPADSVFIPILENIPPLDSFKIWTLENHPDLERLDRGLEARRLLVEVARGEMGPDIFIFGSFKYTKAWSSQRQSAGGDAFTNDPLNDLDGVAGLGIRMNLNFWSKYQKYRKNKLELEQLKRTEVYAAKGLLLRVEEAYIEFLAQKANLKAAESSLRAAEAWLKGAAINYDVDPSLAMEMVAPYKETLEAKRNYFQGIYDYNMALGKLINSVGWTLSRYLDNL